MGLMINPIKIITATILAVLTAQLLKLDFAISAKGIVAVLSLYVAYRILVDRMHLLYSIHITCYNLNSVYLITADYYPHTTQQASLSTHLKTSHPE